MVTLLTDRNVVELLAFASGISRFAVHLLCCHVVKVMFFESVTAETLSCRSNGFAILTCLHVSPVDVQSILSPLSDTGFELLKLGWTHHFATVSIANYLVVLNVRLDVFSVFAIKLKPLHFKF